MKRIPWLLVLAFLVPALGFADVVYLKGGAKLTGRIVDQTETSVSVDIGEGIVGAPMSRVDRIEKGHSPLHEYDDRASKLKPEDVAGWRSLGAYASSQGLAKQSQIAYENVLIYSPDDTEARLAMGYKKINGQWLTEEESYRAQGYIRYEGEWMTPAEAQLSQSAAAAEQANYQAERRAESAQLAAQDAEARAQDAEHRANEAEANSQYNDPVYYGGAWGYGVNYWPQPAYVGQLPANRPVNRPIDRPVNRPVQRPAGRRR